MLLDRIINDGLSPTRKSQNEFSSPCPTCGGTDRFLIWPENNRYWCRQCGVKGDEIQYLRDFHHMTFAEAAEFVGGTIPAPKPKKICDGQYRKKTTPPPKPEQPPRWSESARKIIAGTHINLLKHDTALTWLKLERGITRETAKRFRLGWLDRNLFYDKHHFGLEQDRKKLFIPSGLVIPWQDTRIRVRRDNPGAYGRYHIVERSQTDPFTIGTAYENTTIIVESELDAILLSQEIVRDVFIVALGSAQSKPDDILLKRLNFSPSVFVALDTDEAGAKSSAWWVNNLSNAFRTLTPKEFGKDISESFLNGMNLNEWLSASLQLCAEQISEHS